VDKNNRDIDLQKIQSLDSYWQAWFNMGASIWVGSLIGFLILILTLYYNKQFSPDATVNLVFTIITAGTAYAVLGIYGSYFMNKRYNEYLAFVDKKLAQVEKGERLPSLTELKKLIRAKQNLLL
jgi:hypothetical protein